MANTYTYTITNPGAESGSMTGWTNSNMQANTGVNNGRPPNTGTYYFKGLYNIVTANAYQEFAIVTNSANNDIDNRLCGAYVSWSQNSYTTGNDTGKVELEFYNFAGTSLNLTSAPLNSYTQWTRRTLSANVPPTTRRVRVRMVAVRSSGTDNDAYFDDFTDLVIRTADDVNVATVYTEAVTPLTDLGNSNVISVYTEAVTPLTDLGNSNVISVYTEAVTPLTVDSLYINVSRTYAEVITPPLDSPYINVSRTYTEVITPPTDSPYINVSRSFAEVIAPIFEAPANVYQMYAEVISDISATPLPTKWKNKTISTTVVG